MDYSFTTTPATFATDLAGEDIPAAVKSAIQAVWDATVQTDPRYEVVAATGDLWSVVRIGALRGV